MKLLIDLTLNQAVEKLRKAGLNIGEQKLKVAIKLGVFQGAAWHIPMTNDEFIIIEKDLDDWIAIHSTDREPTAEMWEVSEQIGKMGQRG